MEKPKSRFIKSEDNTIYDSLTSLTWMANDSRLDLEKELSWDETGEYAKQMNEKNSQGTMTGACQPFMRRPHCTRKKN